ncbi:MAG: acyl carrier protein [Gammaproteobacteria bacterium]|jgi:acyl carrier protein
METQALVDNNTTQQEVEQVVIDTVARALDLDPKEVSLSSSLFQDLGAESLDLLDIAFNLERHYGLQLPRLDLLERASEHFGEDTLVKDGIVTDLGLELLRKGMTEVDPSRFQPGLKATDVANMVSLASFVRIVMRLLEVKQNPPAECPGCGASTIIASKVHPEWICEQCEATIPMPSGDEVLLQDIIDLQ